MTLPHSVRNEVEERLSELCGAPTRITETTRLGGGCINPSARLRTDTGDTWFLKWNDDAPENFFRVEARGLRELSAPGVLRIPEVIATDSGEAVSSVSAIRWLLLEFVERATEAPGYGERLGRELAEHHQVTCGPTHGGEDNYIGPLPQSGHERVDWPTFWWEERLAPRLESVLRRGHLRDTEPAFRALRVRLPELLSGAEEDGMSLLHGDLWSGNVFAGPDGDPVLVDPSVYRGHREVDLAMTSLFGGFGADFYRAYQEGWPLPPGQEARRDVYQLYPLLVHVELFGSGYESGVRAALERLV